jgi:hypothetical protein
MAEDESPEEGITWREVIINHNGMESDSLSYDLKKTKRKKNKSMIAKN